MKTRAEYDNDFLKRFSPTNYAMLYFLDEELVRLAQAVERVQNLRQYLREAMGLASSSTEGTEP
jgi:hypothetical protein